MTNTPNNWIGNARRIGPSASNVAFPVIVAEPVPDPLGTVLLVHGRDGAPDQAQIAEIANAYLTRGWRVVAPELPYSAALLQSGPPEKISFSSHTQAAGAVWAWVAQEWPEGPRALAGHSLGGFAVAHLAADDPVTHHVLALSPVLSGRLLLAARAAMGPAALDEVRRTAPAYLAEMEIADAGPALHHVAAPLAVVTGAADGLIRLADARAYFAAAPNGRYFAALPDQHHCPSGAACAGALSGALAMLGG